MIYAGGGIMKADAANELRELAELTGIPRRHHADGARRASRRAPAVSRHARHARQLHRGHVDAEGRPAHHARCALRRPRHRQGLERSRPTPRSSTSTSTRPSWARCAAPTCRSSATARRDRGADQGGEAPSRQARTRPITRAWITRCTTGRNDYPLKYTQEEGGPLKPQFVHRGAARQHARRLHPRGGRGSAPDVGEPAAGSSTSRTRG